MTDDCIFCAIVRGDAPAEVIREDERTLAFMDIAPATRGHALVIPKTHARDVLEIAVEDLQAVAAAGQEVARWATTRLGATGVNLVNSCGADAWQTVFHLHLHVVPRYPADPLQLPWIPVAGEREEIAAAAGDYRG